MSNQLPTESGEYWIYFINWSLPKKAIVFKNHNRLRAVYGDEMQFLHRQIVDCNAHSFPGYTLSSFGRNFLWKKIKKLT